jgi:anti-sigma factor ChrR (cupin superfamily)
MECQWKDLLPEFVLGEVTTTSTDSIESHLTSCAECRAELILLQRVFTDLVDDLPRVQLNKATQEHLFLQVEGVRRFDPFILSVATLFDITPEASERYLHGLDSALWLPGPAEGIQIARVEAGPRLATATTGFVRLAPQVRFPQHRHLNGEEHVFLIQGAYQDESGEIVKRGQLASLPSLHNHHLTALDGPVCIGAVVHFGHEYF